MTWTQPHSSEQREDLHSGPLVFPLFQVPSALPHLSEILKGHDVNPAPGGWYQMEPD